MFENTLRYSTFADRSQVENRIESYETLIVPSHLLVGGKNAVPPLIHQLHEAGEIEYYIDPAITEFHRGYSFRDGGEIKQWHTKLLNELGNPIDEVMGNNRNLVYEDLDPDQRDDIIESVCDLQESFVQEAVEEQMGKYEPALMEDITPRAVIPWYVKIEDFEDLEPNRYIINQTKEITDLPVKPCIHVDKSFLSDINARQSIAELISDSGLDEMFLWIDNLNKYSTEIDEYIDYLRTVIELASNDIRPHAMYGDFFSNLLAYFGLRGIGFGTYHGEDKAEKLEPGGGGNLQRYYFDPVKDFLTIYESVELGQQHNAEIPPYSRLGSWDRLYRLGEDHDFLKNHFIRTKNHHRQLISAEDIDDVLNDLRADYEIYGDDLRDSETSKTAEHLRKWVATISEFESDYEDEYQEALATAEAQIEQEDSW